MIGYLSGVVLDSRMGHLLVGVGDSARGQVGYSVTMPIAPGDSEPLQGDEVALFIYTHVREDLLDLYGFRSRQDKDLFLTLMSVSGIGPKVACGILSHVSSGGLIQTILRGEVETLVKIPGIGKKTAERIVLELRDTLKKKIEMGVLPVGSDSLTNSSRSEKSLWQSEVVRDAKQALIGLGYRESEILPLLERVCAAEEGSESKNKPKRAEDIIRVALQQLGV